jgi:hypothetical protein
MQGPSPDRRLSRVGTLLLACFPSPPLPCSATCAPHLFLTRSHSHAPWRAAPGWSRKGELAAALQDCFSPPPRLLPLCSNKFTFDRVFGMDSTQVEVYDFTARPVVEEALKGYNWCEERGCVCGPSCCCN